MPATSLTRTRVTQDQSFSNNLSTLDYVRRYLANSDYLQSVNSYLILSAYTALSVWYFTYFSLMENIFYPLSFISTFTSAFMSWKKLFHEYLIQRSIRLPTLAKAVVDTLILAATGVAVLGGLLAFRVFQPLLTPFLLVGTFAIKSVYDYVSAAGHLYQSFSNTITPHERQVQRKSALKSLLSGLANTLVVAGFGILQFTGLSIAFPLTFGLVATTIGTCVALFNKIDSKKIEVIKSKSTTAQVANVLNITRRDVVYGLERNKIQEQLPTTQLIQVPAPLFQVAPPMPARVEGDQQQVNGAFRLV